MNQQDAERMYVEALIRVSYPFRVVYASPSIDTDASNAIPRIPPDLAWLL